MRHLYPYNNVKLLRKFFYINIVEQPSVLNKFISELQYSAAFGCESRKFAGGVRKYAKFRHFLAHPVV